MPYNATQTVSHHLLDLVTTLRGVLPCFGLANRLLCGFWKLLETESADNGQDDMQHCGRTKGTVSIGLIE